MKKISFMACVATASILLALTASTATAEKLHNGSSSCSQSTTQPFLPWLDPGSYFLAPGGDFESGLAGWTTTGGAKVVSGNESYYVTSSRDSHSLYLPAGSSVTTPSMCISLDSPDLRVFVKNNGSLLTVMNVTVNYQDASGKRRSLLLVPMVGLSTWTPSLPELILANITSILSSNGQTQVSFTFAPVGIGITQWQIDDLYVDPIKHI
jgi:hypothetical protein